MGICFPFLERKNIFTTMNLNVKIISFPLYIQLHRQNSMACCLGVRKWLANVINACRCAGNHVNEVVAEQGLARYNNMKVTLPRGCPVRADEQEDKIEEEKLSLKSDYFYGKLDVNKKAL